MNQIEFPSFIHGQSVIFFVNVLQIDVSKLKLNLIGSDAARFFFLRKLNEVQRIVKKNSSASTIAIQSPAAKKR